MQENLIYIRYYSTNYDYALLHEYEEQLQQYEIQLAKEDLHGKIICGELDFISLDLIIFSYSLIQDLMIAGTYDVLKMILRNIWTSIRPSGNKHVPFTIELVGIPTISGSENISCKISGDVYESQKEKVVDEIYKLANNICNNTFELQKKSIYYDVFGAHIFNIGSETLEPVEIDIESEIRKKSKK